MTQGFNPELLRIARQSRGWSQAELSERANVSHSRLSKIEAGLIDPAAVNVDNMVEALHFPSSFFFEPDEITGLPISIHPMYRKKANIGRRKILRVEAELNLRLFHIRRLLKAVAFEPVIELPNLDINEFEGGSEGIAYLLRRMWQMPTGPIRNLMNWVEKAGVLVVQCDFGSLPIDGVTMRSIDLPPCVFLGNKKPSDRQRYSLAHELGHIIMHQYRIPSPAMEDEANSFASALLMPTPDILPYLSERITLQRLANLKLSWRVSMQALLYRAKDIGTITAGQSQYLWRQISARGYRKQEPPSLNLPIEKATVLPGIISMHIEDMDYTVEQLSSVLHLFEDDLRIMYPLPGKTDGPTLQRVK